MIHARISTTIATLLCLLSVTVTGAQTLETAETRMVRNDAERIPIGATVKLRMRNGERLNAVLFDVDEAAIRVKPVTRRPEPSRRLAYDAIETIERRQDRVSFGKYAAIGVGIGAAAFLTLLGIAASY